jgi:putative hydrolase of the HAD superfamily
MMKKYTHIFFDLDNTLWDFEKNSESAMLETFNHFNISELSINFNDFFKSYSKHNHDLWAKYRKKEVGKKELIKSRFQNTFLEVGVKGIEPEKMNDYYLNEMPKQNKLFDGVLETLEYLKGRKYKMNIITNGFREVQYKKLEQSGLMPFFGKVFTSEEIKCPKPNREIFEYAVKSVNAKKKKSIMIGDDWEVDILGATKFGIDAIHFSQKENGSLDTGFITTIRKSNVLTIDSIKRLVDIF